MKGYLSRIANQIRLPVPGRRVKKMSEAAEPCADKLPDPLERTQTVMVQPTAATTDTGKRDSSKVRVPKRTDDKKGTPKQEQSVIHVIDISEASVPVSDTTIPPELRTAKPKEGDSQPSANVKVADVTETKPQEIVKTVHVEPPAVRNPDENKKKEPGKDNEVIRIEPEIKPDIQFFLKTAEIIQKRDTDKDEVQTVLLSEIQEWVAAGSEGEAQPEMRVVSDEPEELGMDASEAREVLPISEPEPVVVRIGEKKHHESATKEITTVQENSFDLSIGTISVVIEGGEPPPQPAPARQPDKQANTENRGRLCLSRNYI